MESVTDVIRWLKALDKGSSVGIDEGGLCLREIDKNGERTEAYYKIGGIPEDQEP